MVTAAAPIRLTEVTLVLCSLCLNGAGGECHVPGCALYMNRAPDVSLLTGPDTVFIGPSWPLAEEAYVTEPGSRTPEAHPQPLSDEEFEEAWREMEPP